MSIFDKLAGLVLRAAARRSTEAQHALKIYNGVLEEIQKHYQENDPQNTLVAFAIALTDIILTEEKGIKVSGTAAKMLRDAGLIK